MAGAFSTHLTAKQIAADVRIRRQVHKGSFALVEGSTDIKRYRNIFHHQCQTVNCWGKSKAVEAIEQLYDDGFPGVLAIIDADFDRVLGKLATHEGVCHSTTHDFDYDVVSTEALIRYLEEVTDASKAQAYGGIGHIRERISRSILPLSLLRYTNERYQLGYRLKDLELDAFYDGESCNIQELIEVVSTGSFSSKMHKQNLADLLDTELKKSWTNLDQITSGHDFCYALGIALRDKIGSRKHLQTWKSEVELHLRLTVEFEDFEALPSFAMIKDWEAENAPYRIVRR